MPITNEQELRDFHEKAKLALFFYAHNAGMMGLDLTAQKMRTTTAFRNVTGNLRASIGHFGPISPTLFSLNLGEPDLETLISRIADGLRFTLPIGMSYAQDVQDRTGFADEAVNAAPEIFEGAFGDAQIALDLELMRLAS